MHERVVLSDDAASKLEAGQEVQAAEVLQLTRRGGLDLDAYDAPVSGFED